MSAQNPRRGQSSTSRALTQQQSSTSRALAQQQFTEQQTTQQQPNGQLPTEEPRGRPELVIGFTNEKARTEAAERAIIIYAATDKRIANVTVKCPPKKFGDKAYHTGGTDPRSVEHLTLLCRDSQFRTIGTRHVDRNGRIV